MRPIEGGGQFVSFGANSPIGVGANAWQIRPYGEFVPGYLSLRLLAGLPGGLQGDGHKPKTGILAIQLVACTAKAAVFSSLQGWQTLQSAFLLAKMHLAGLDIAFIVSLGWVGG